MTTHRRAAILAVLMLAGALLAPEPSMAKQCRSACRTEISTCKAGCPSGRLRRRCRSTCRRLTVDACRQNAAAACLAPGEPVPTTPFHPTSTSTTFVATSTTTTTTLPGGGGGSGPTTGFMPEWHVTSSGADRTYALSVPPSYDPARAYPLVFAFHGDGGSGVALRSYIGVEEQASGAAIFVYPNATEESGRHWTLDASLDANPDMRFFLDIIDQLAAIYHVDVTRVFATGHSSGGFFVNFLNCTLGSPILRAIAPHSGSGPYGNAWDYDVNGYFECPGNPTAAILIHGTNDGVVPLHDAEYSHRQWIFENGCSEFTSPAAPAPCVVHDACDDRPVTWCAVDGIGHSWWNQAGEAIWRFFARFLGPTEPSGTTMRVGGRDLYDPEGQKVILRGVNKMNVFDPTDQDGAVSFPQIRSTGANTVRIVWMTQTAFFVPTAADLDTILGNAIENQLIPMIELHDATGDLGGVPALVDYWTRPDIAAVLRKHERFLLVNVANEAGDWDTTADEFVPVYLDAIARLRAAGIRSPLVIDAPDSGKNIDVLLEVAQQLIAADPDHNLLFSVHVYWPIAWGMGGDYIWWKLGSAAGSGVPFVVGEFSRYGAWTANGVGLCAPAGEVDYQTVLQAAQYFGIGWYAWEWGPGNGYNDPACAVMDMTADNRIATLQPGWATDVVSGPYGIVATSVIPQSIKQ